jgi:hypothetical protein
LKSRRNIQKEHSDQGRSKIYLFGELLLRIY